jgi:hypothetical protein
VDQICIRGNTSFEKACTDPKLALVLGEYVTIEDTNVPMTPHRYVIFSKSKKFGEAILNSTNGSTEDSRSRASSSNIRYVVETLRPLRGRNKALLVKGNDGRYFVQKFHGAAHNSDSLFNEAFASQLGAALDLSFPAWSELAGHSSDRNYSSFGSELISGDILEYLPGGWYLNVANSADAYRCLLFDLWCNRTDSRQAVFQRRPPRVFHAYFFDHDQMFSLEDGAPLSKRIARTRCLDFRIYKQDLASVVQELSRLADRIRMLGRSELHRVAKSVPASWGSITHREQAVLGLEHRTGQLQAYIEAIAQFGASLGH